MIWWLLRLVWNLGVWPREGGAGERRGRGGSGGRRRFSGRVPCSRKRIVAGTSERYLAIWKANSLSSHKIEVEKGFRHGMILMCGTALPNTRWLQ